ncbi:hypothetical protein RM533_08690 [Croceicoccus sp. F390]|uniref:Uncharacterized protein n=1 Tax=Croceicoccus esteveae TaxID=3075597 RepID=A0ABU2ZI26_9SPHN|nr:hypothetical protein [Croceicoccus sp. F390]MDT0576262.1 hypothetical protein [Croceicoccus sp. F390]
MTTRHLVDSELLDLVDSFPPMELSDKRLPMMREMFSGVLNEQELPDLPIETREIAVPSREEGHSRWRRARQQSSISTVADM